MGGHISNPLGENIVVTQPIECITETKWLCSYFDSLDKPIVLFRIMVARNIKP